MRISFIERGFLIITLLAAFVLAGCSNEKAFKQELVSRSFAESANDPEFQFKAFQSLPDSVDFLFRLNTERLLYARTETGDLAAVVVIEINVQNKTSDGAAIPSKSIRIIDRDEARLAKTLQAATRMYLPRGSTYRVDFNVKDVQRQQSYPNYTDLNRIDSDDRSNFLVINDSSDLAIFGDRIGPKRTYKILSYAINTGTTKIRVDYYNREFPLPPPPFIEYNPDSFNYQPDSIFYLKPNLENELTLKSAREGFYHFRIDTTSKKGLSLFVSESEFPKVTTVKNMIEPFRYLLSNNEYKNIHNRDYDRAEFEKIWVNWAGSKDRAKACIKAYYSRVEYSNKYFSSHVDGWKSDRGLVYIVHGKPNKVYSTELVERWIYGEENNPLSITFNFVTVINPFTDNDFRLNREDFYKPSWYRAVNAWRDGRIY